MLFRSTIEVLALATVLMVTVSGAQADDAKYPNWKGQWVRFGGPPLQFRGPVVERESILLEQYAPRQRVAVGVQARGRDADERVARGDVVAGDDVVELDGPDARRAQVEAVRRRVAPDELGQDGQLAARDLTARGLGAEWAGGSDEMPPEPLDAAIIFAMPGDLVPVALTAVRKGGRVVCAGIHMSDIPSFPYRTLWEERQLMSVANLTRQDGLDFLRLAPGIGIVTRTTAYPLQRANEALADLRAGRFEGAAVLVPQAR